MMEILLLISCFVWFGIGYILGSRISIKDGIQTIQKGLQKGLQKQVPVGGIMRPTSQQVNKQQDKLTQEEEEEMERNLKLMFPHYKKDKNIN